MFVIKLFQHPTHHTVIPPFRSLPPVAFIIKTTINFPHYHFQASAVIYHEPTAVNGKHLRQFSLLAEQVQPKYANSNISHNLIVM